MNASSSPFSNHEPPRLETTSPKEAESQISPPEYRANKSGLNLIRWIQGNSFASEWLPEQLRNPLVGYLVAGLIELAAAGLIFLLLSLFPSTAYYGVLALVGVVLIAFGWGAGPGLLATLMGTLLLYFMVLPPYYAGMLADPANGIGLLMYLLVGTSISLLAGQRERSRRQAQDAARLLAQAAARSRTDAERLRTMLDVLPSAVMIASPQGELLAMNQATKALWGGEVPLGTNITQYSQYNQFKSWWATTGQPLAPKDWTLVRALASGKVVLNEELEIETLDGQRRVILNSAAPMRDEAGAITGAVASAQDISALRHLEREETEHARELEAIFEAMTDGIAFLDSHGRLVRTNHAFRTLHGVERHPEFLALPMEQRFAMLALADEQGQPLAVEARPVTRLLQGETLTGIDVQVKNLEGRKVVFNVSGAPIRDQLGQVTGCVEVFRDMTARHHLEQRTRETLGALMAMAEAMVQVRPAIPAGELKEEPPSALVSDAALPLVARRLAELTRSVLGCRHVSIAAVDAPTGRLVPVMEVGLPPEQEQAWWASWSPAQNLEERYGLAIATSLYAGKSALLDTHRLPERSWYTLFQAQTGRLVPMLLGEELVGILMVAYQGQDHDYSREEEVLLTGTLAQLGALVLERDQLLRHWAEARANELALGEIKAQMDTFLGIASHELKTPLTSLKLSLQLTDRRLRKITQGKTGAVPSKDVAPQEAFEQLSRTAHQMGRLERLVNDLVDVSRIQAGKLELQPDQIDLLATVREAVREQREAAPDRRIHLECPANLSVPVYADAGRIEQVVTNFLTNALKYSSADRSVDVGVQVDQDRARVWVRDQGPGLPLEEQEQIWERFHRARGVEVQSGTGVGLGLGLHISRMIVDRHHGQAGVESSPGKGSTFWFTLPLGSPAE
ncbi:MAG: ATP-binding protein [Ktedonobacterales bacterium]